MVDRRYTTGRAAEMWTTTADGDDLADQIPEQVDSSKVGLHGDIMMMVYKDE